MSRFSASHAAGFYRTAQDLLVSTLGQGSYLGEMDDATDGAYTEAALAALDGGINFFDTSLNYRHQRSERAFGKAFRSALEGGLAARDEFAVCTKAGFLVPGAVPADLRPEEIAGNMHSTSPAFLRDQIERSRQNLGLATIDVFYLHNPETQLRFVKVEEFYSKVRSAFETLESLTAAGLIRFYGTATWDGYRRGLESGSLSLSRLAAIAEDIAGSDHHFRFVQLPFNLAMPEALTIKADGGRTVLDWAEELGITVVASASILQSRLATELPPTLAEKIRGPSTNAQRAIQFVRSTPGISVALVGMSQAMHVCENLGIATFPPATLDEYEQFFR
ncbi:MAG: aldo/keto reductase [Bryobacteraceae bacterium]